MSTESFVMVDDLQPYRYEQPQAGMHTDQAMPAADNEFSRSRTRSNTPVSDVRCQGLDVHNLSADPAQQGNGV